MGEKESKNDVNIILLYNTLKNKNKFKKEIMS